MEKFIMSTKHQNQKYYSFKNGSKNCLYKYHQIWLQPICDQMSLTDLAQT